MSLELAALYVPDRDLFIVTLKTKTAKPKL